MRRIKILLLNFKFFLRDLKIRSLYDNIRYMFYSNLLVFSEKNKYHEKLHELNMSFMYKNLISKRDLEEMQFECDEKELVNQYYIWLFWWQGYDNMPDIVKATINSIKKASNKKIIFLNKDNIFDYIQIPEYILEKVKKRKIGLAHFSDYIRISILAKHGGLWLDSTILCVKPIPDWVFKESFFTIHADSDGNKYIPKGKWNMQVLGSNTKNCPIFVFMKFFLELYWKKYDQALDYLFFDYGMQIQYENLEISKTLIQKVPKSNPLMHQLRVIINNEFNELLWKDIVNGNTWMYKLTYKDEFIFKNNDRNTFYSYILRNYK